MNDKINIKDFAQRISVETGVDPTLTQKFIKAYFDGIASTLHADGIVTIKGLGTFSVTKDIDNPLRFSASPDFAGEVNSPFSVFEPVEIPDDVDVASVDDSLAQDYIIESDTNDSDVVEVKDDAEVSTDSDEIVTTEADKQDAAVSNDDLTADNNDVVDALTDNDTPDMSNIIDSSDESIIKVDEVMPESVKEESLYIPEDEEEYVDYSQTDHKSKMTFGSGFLCGLLAGLIIGGISLFVYAMYYVNA